MLFGVPLHRLDGLYRGRKIKRMKYWHRNSRASFRSSTFHCFACLNFVFNDKLHRVCTNVEASADYRVRVAAAYSLADSSFSLIFARRTHRWSESFLFAKKKHDHSCDVVLAIIVVAFTAAAAAAAVGIRSNVRSGKKTVYTESSQKMCIDILWTWWTGERRSNNCAHRWLNVCTTHTCFYYIILSHSQCE